MSKIQVLLLGLLGVIVLFIAACAPAGEEPTALAGEATMRTGSTVCRDMDDIAGLSSDDAFESTDSVFIAGNAQGGRVRTSSSGVETTTWSSARADVCGTGRNRNRLSEFYCSVAGSVIREYVNCPNGCTAGACVPATCDDSTGGATGVMLTDSIFLSVPPSQFSAQRYTDSCVDTSTRRQYNCEGSFVVQADSACVTGLFCSDGVCIACGNSVVDVGENCLTCPADAACAAGQLCQEGICGDPGVGATAVEICNDVDEGCQSACTDSDSSDSPTVPGSVTYQTAQGTFLVSDFCFAAGSESVQEYYCVGNSYASREIACPTGMTCQDSDGSMNPTIPARCQ